MYKLLFFCLAGVVVKVSCSPVVSPYAILFSPTFGNEGTAHFADPLPQNPNMEAREVIVQHDRDGVYVIQFLIGDNAGTNVSFLKSPSNSLFN